MAGALLILLVCASLHRAGFWGIFGNRRPLGPMLLDSHEPISAPCARTVEPAVAALLRLGITQHEVIEHLSRALGIVRCVLDYQQSIPPPPADGPEPRFLDAASADPGPSAGNRPARPLHHLGMYP